MLPYLNPIVRWCTPSNTFNLTTIFPLLLTLAALYRQQVVIIAVDVDGRNFTPIKQSFTIMEIIRAVGIQMVNSDEEIGSSGGPITQIARSVPLAPPYRGAK